MFLYHSHIELCYASVMLYTMLCYYILYYSNIMLLCGGHHVVANKNN